MFLFRPMISYCVDILACTLWSLLAQSGSTVWKLVSQMTCLFRIWYCLWFLEEAILMLSARPVSKKWIQETNGIKDLTPFWTRDQQPPHPCPPCGWYQHSSKYPNVYVDKTVHEQRQRPVRSFCFSLAYNKVLTFFTLVWMFVFFYRCSCIFCFKFPGYNFFLRALRFNEVVGDPI